MLLELLGCTSAFEGDGRINITVALFAALIRGRGRELEPASAKHLTDTTGCRHGSEGAEDHQHVTADVVVTCYGCYG